MKKQFLEAGRIVGTHGVRGEMRVEPWCDSAEFLKKLKRLYFDEGRADAGLVASRVHKSFLLVRLEGVEKSTNVSFRVRRICGRSTILVKSGDTVIARFKRDRLAPGEMEHIALPRVLLDRAPVDEVTIEIEEA